MSDLHCHLQAEIDPITKQITRRNDSYLKVAALRRPSTHHPVQALIDLIREEQLSAGALLIPGDLANQASPEGLAHGWDLALEVGRELKTTHVIPVLGNHDLDTHGVREMPTPVHAAQMLRPGFPFASPALCNQFFTDGYCTLLLKQDVEVIAVNSVIDYSNPTVAKRGSFKIERVENLRQDLKRRPRTKLRIALMHHHPTLHTTRFLNEHDVIETGDQLLEALAEVGCGLVIHGHKHQPRLTYTNPLGIKLPVFAAGSFSAILNVVGSLSRNLFHVIEISALNTAEIPARGRVTSWEWAIGTGWVKAKLFPFKIGFGRQETLESIIERLRLLATRQSAKRSFDHAEILSAAPDLQFSTEDEVRRILQDLRAKFGLALSEIEGNWEMGRLHRAKRSVTR